MEFLGREVVKFVLRNKEGHIYHETENGSWESYTFVNDMMHKLTDEKYKTAISWKDLPVLGEAYIDYIFGDKDEVVH